MSIVYRTPGIWGPGKGSNLSPQEVDENFYELVTDIANKAAQGESIANFVVVGDQMTVVLSDGTLLGPYTLPVAKLTFRGEWASSTPYLANDIFTHGGSTYIVNQNHTSALTFDPNANDGQGNNLYGLLLQNPGISVPLGGAAGAFLRKASTTDLDTIWAPAALDDLSDAIISTPTANQLLTYISGAWRNATLNLLLDQLADVIQTTAIPGQPLVYNGLQWVNTSTIDLPAGIQQSATGTVAINRANGEIQRFRATGNVTTVTFTGWPVAGQLARIVLEIQNTGNFTWTWPSSGANKVLWPGGAVPVLTAGSGKKDVYALLSFDGGTTIYGNTVGQNFS